MDRRLINNDHLATVTRKFDEFSPISLRCPTPIFFSFPFLQNLSSTFFLTVFSIFQHSTRQDSPHKLNGWTEDRAWSMSLRNLAIFFDLLIIFLKYFRRRMRRWNFTYTHLHARTIYFQVLINSRNETTDTRGYELTRCYSSNMYVSYVRR